MGLLKSIVKLIMGYKEIEFHVAGVTFKNGRKTRQAILRAMKFRDEPFDKEINITFEKYEYEVEPAIYVKANGQIIGNVPRDKLQEFLKKWTGDYMIERYKVVGSTDKNFGCIVRVLFDR